MNSLSISYTSDSSTNQSTIHFTNQYIYESSPAAIFSFNLFSTFAFLFGETPCFLVPSIVNDDIEAADAFFGAPLLACAALGARTAAAAARPSARASRRFWTGAWAWHTVVVRFCVQKTKGYVRG